MILCFCNVCYVYYHSFVYIVTSCNNCTVAVRRFFPTKIILLSSLLLSDLVAMNVKFLKVASRLTVVFDCGIVDCV